MKSLGYSQISSSEDSDEEIKNPSTSKISTTTKNSDGSSDSSDSEGGSRHNSSLHKQITSKTNGKKNIDDSPLRQFTVTNPDLKKQESRLIIGEDDEVCFLEVPKSLDIEQLLGKSVNFEKRTKVKINNARYVIEPTDESIKPIGLLTKKLQVIQPVARLQLREYTKHKNVAVEVESVKFKPSLPENLKVRHPLFGAEYKNKIVLSEEIEKKLDSTIDNFVKKMKKKKSKEKKSDEGTNIKQEETTENEEAIFALLESQSPGKKKKKKHRKDVATDVEENEIEEKIYDGKNKKNNVINSTIIPGLQLPSFEFDISGIANKDESITEKPKKKKSKSFPSVNVSYSDTEETQVSNETNTKIKRKKEKRCNESEYETEKEESPRKKKKTIHSQSLDNEIDANKKKIKEENDFDSKLSSAEDSFKKRKQSNFSQSEEDTHVESDIKKNKKKKKIKPEKEENNLIMNLLSMVKDEMDDTNRKKKHRSSDR